jgi:hypothetical protein
MKTIPFRRIGATDSVAPASVVDQGIGIPPALDFSNYSFSQFEKDVSSFKPRLFDTYILPGFIMFYAWKSKSMSRTARRMLFIAGMYMAYRNYNEYKNLALSIKALAQGTGSTVEAKAV